MKIKYLLFFILCTYSLFAQKNQNNAIIRNFPYWEFNIQTGYLPLLGLGISISPVKSIFLEVNAGSLILTNELFVTGEFQSVKDNRYRTNRLGIGYMIGIIIICIPADCDNEIAHGPLLYVSRINF